MTTTERDQIGAAFAEAGFRNAAQGVRICCLAFARDAAIRQAVLRWLAGPGSEAR